MAEKSTVAAIQMVSSNKLEDNLASAADLMRQAAEAGASLLVLPETFAMFSGRAQIELGKAEASEQAVVRPFLAEQAKQLGVWIVAGTVPLYDAAVDASRVSSACLLIDDQGREVSRYNKIHLFDVEVDDAKGSYRESDTFVPGNEVVVVDTPFGKLGLAVCYDIRFPEMFRIMFQQQVDILAIPAAFTLMTGEAHWLALLRARAIENQCYVIGANQGGQHSSSRSTSGGSVILDAWGNVLAEAGRGACVVTTEVNLEKLAKQRRAMPCYQHQVFRLDESSRLTKAS